MLSGIEIPLLDAAAADPLGGYLAGLGRLAGLAGVRWLVPGHGTAGDAAEFRRRVAADARYLELLASGRPFADPRCTAGWLCEAHRARLALAGPGGRA